jgi:hypothetical protein
VGAVPLKTVADEVGLQLGEDHGSHMPHTRARDVPRN